MRPRVWPRPGTRAVARMPPLRGWWILPVTLSLTACSLAPLTPPREVKASNVNSDAALTPVTRITRDLVQLPPPQFKVPVAVYAFRDQTGQFRGQPESNLSNAVTQGAASILVKALLDSGWYLPIEREGFQNLLNERRVARAIEVPADRGKVGASYPQLIPAQFIIEGGIVGYETNVRTGGQGANLLGVGGEAKYRIDQVTVILRSVDVRTGQVANSVSVTKKIFSHEISSSIYKFVSYKTLLQAEGGYSSNEPSQLAVKEAIEAAVVHLTVQGISGRVWSLKNDQDWYAPVVQNYLRESEAQLAAEGAEASSAGTAVSMRGTSLVRPAQLPLHLVAIPTEIQSPATTVTPPVRTASAPAPVSNGPKSPQVASQALALSAASVSQAATVQVPVTPSPSSAQLPVPTSDVAQTAAAVLSVPAPLETRAATVEVASPPLAFAVASVSQAATVQVPVTPSPSAVQLPVPTSDVAQTAAAAVLSAPAPLPTRAATVEVASPPLALAAASVSQAAMVQVPVTPSPSAAQLPVPSSDLAQTVAAVVLSAPAPLATRVATVDKPYVAPRQADPSEPPEADLLLAQFADGS
jgi:curli production assembly/transport component CsgG